MRDFRNRISFLIAVILLFGITMTFSVNEYQKTRGLILESVVQEEAAAPIELIRVAPPDEKKVVEEPRFVPEAILSSETLEQGDTLVIRIPALPEGGEIKGTFDSKEINFFRTVDKTLLSIIGIGHRQEPGSYALGINFPNNQIIQKTIRVSERDFPITELVLTKELEEKGYTPTTIVEDILTKENTAVREVTAAYVPRAYFENAFAYPLENVSVVGAFGNIRKSGDSEIQHVGVDLEADKSTPVYAVNDGVVRMIREFTNYGKTIIVDHGIGIYSLYLHLDAFNVKEGDEVTTERIIGYSGNTGYSIDPHLHFSVKVSEASVDPLRFIEATKRAMAQ